MSILARPLEVASIGVTLFAEALVEQGVRVEQILWQPPLEAAASALGRLAEHAALIERANDVAVERMQEAKPLLTGIGRAGDCIDGLEPQTILHAGPPIAWADMAGPLRGAIIGGALYEGLADSAEEAERKAAAGVFELVPCHERGAVGPMAGVITASMPVWKVSDPGGERLACSTFNEGLGRTLRFGAFGPDVLERLQWLERVLAPVLDDALRRLPEPLDLRSLIAQALQMGDDVHNRHRAGSSLLLRELLPVLLEVERPVAEVRDAARFIAGNDHFFLNLAMAAAKLTADAAAGVGGSSIVVTMARNATTFGIRVSGTGARWFTGEAGVVEGLYLPGFGPADAARDLGDSAITETVGLGAFAMAAAPAIVRYVGGAAADAPEITRTMRQIVWSESRSYEIPALDFEGTPLGIDCRAVARTGIAPVINTGIAHREAGVGQIGAGVVRAPLEPFAAAVNALADAMESETREAVEEWPTSAG